MTPATWAAVQRRQCLYATWAPRLQQGAGLPLGARCFRAWRAQSQVGPVERLVGRMIRADKRQYAE
eukprot:4482655-Lingulodinium_polyedra.AAC.1